MADDTPPPALTDPISAALLVALADLGTANADRISAASGVALPEARRKLRLWADAGQITRTGDTDPMFELLPDGTAAASTLHRLPHPPEHDPTSRITDADLQQSGAGRRRPATLSTAVLAVLDEHPEQGFRVAEIVRLIEQRFTAAGLPAKKVSAGAVRNALHKAAGDGVLLRVEEHPATYQARRTPTAGRGPTAQRRIEPHSPPST